MVYLDNVGSEHHAASKHPSAAQSVNLDLGEHLLWMTTKLLWIVHLNSCKSLMAEVCPVKWILVPQAHKFLVAVGELSQ